MLRRSILEVSCRQTLKGNPRHLVNQHIPSPLSSRKKFSTASKPGGASAPGSTSNPPGSKGSLSKILMGSMVLGGAAAFLAEKYLQKEPRSVTQEAQVNTANGDSKNVHPSMDQLISPHSEKPNSENPVLEHAELKVDTHSPEQGNVTVDQGDKPIQEQDKSDVTSQENQLPEYPQSGLASDDPSNESVVQSENTVGIRTSEGDIAPGLEEGIQHSSTSTKSSAVPEENDMENIQLQQQEIPEIEERENTLDKNIEKQSNLLEEYHLRNGGRPATENIHFPEEIEGISGAMEELKDVYISKDGKLVLDFLQAIHAAEKRQADLDARAFNEEKKVLKEKYEKKLKDAAARELMLAEEVAMLDKELKRERAKAALAIKSLQEKMEEKLKKELEQKEIETEAKVNKAQELAKAEINAAIANEKAAQIEKMAEANVNINALCMAFYARSEEARQSHAARHFALGALALEEALTKGLPIQTELASLQASLEGVDKDSVLDLVLSSLPEETRKKGTETPLQLKQEFDALKGTLRHFSFFPPGGGGILAHSLAHMASWLKVNEADQSGDGIESVINKVDSYLAEGKLAEAADFLEEHVQGTQAAEVIAGWVRQARNRAISEQAVVLLQSYANSISLT